MNEKVRLKQAIKPKKNKLLNLKVTPKEMHQIQLKADKYTGGNVSEWIRYASIQLEPRVSDLVTSVPKTA